VDRLSKRLPSGVGPSADDLAQAGLKEMRRGNGNVSDVADEGLPGFGERLLAVIDEGRGISTYELAVLLALIDCAPSA
jgi:hypothetical protein